MKTKLWRIIDRNKPWDGDTVRGEDWNEAMNEAENHIAGYLEDFELEECHDPED